MNKDYDRYQDLHSKDPDNFPALGKLPILNSVNPNNSFNTERPNKDSIKILSVDKSVKIGNIASIVTSISQDSTISLEETSNEIILKIKYPNPSYIRELRDYGEKLAKHQQDCFEYNSVKDIYDRTHRRNQDLIDQAKTLHPDLWSDHHLTSD